MHGYGREVAECFLALWSLKGEMLENGSKFKVQSSKFTCRVQRLCESVLYKGRGCVRSKVMRGVKGY